jgi:hypothetical protein
LVAIGIGALAPEEALRAPPGALLGVTPDASSASSGRPMWPRCSASPRADARWPFDSVDPNGAKLVENIGLTLTLPPDCKLSYTRFILLQRVAQEGGRTLSLALVTTRPRNRPCST